MLPNMNTGVHPGYASAFQARMQLLQRSVERSAMESWQNDLLSLRPPSATQGKHPSATTVLNLQEVQRLGGFPRLAPMLRGQHMQSTSRGTSMPFAAPSNLPYECAALNRNKNCPQAESEFPKQLEQQKEFTPNKRRRVDILSRPSDKSKRIEALLRGPSPNSDLPAMDLGIGERAPSLEGVIQSAFMPSGLRVRPVRGEPDDSIRLPVPTPAPHDPSASAIAPAIASPTHQPPASFCHHCRWEGSPSTARAQ
jgi:hypothetical protein